MSPEMLTAIGAVILAVAALIGAVVTGFVARANSKRAAVAAEAAAVATLEGNAQLVVIDGAVRELGKAVDGRLTELLAATKLAADAQISAEHSRGYKDGEQAQRDRAAGPTP